MKSLEIVCNAEKAKFFLFPKHSNAIQCQLGVKKSGANRKADPHSNTNPKCETQNKTNGRRRKRSRKIKQQLQAPCAFRLIWLRFSSLSISGSLSTVNFVLEKIHNLYCFNNGSLFIWILIHTKVWKFANVCSLINVENFFEIQWELIKSSWAFRQNVKPFGRSIWVAMFMASRPFTAAALVFVVNFLPSFWVRHLACINCSNEILHIYGSRENTSTAQNPCSKIGPYNIDEIGIQFPLSLFRSLSFRVFTLSHQSSHCFCGNASTIEFNSPFRHSSWNIARRSFFCVCSFWKHVPQLPLLPEICNNGSSKLARKCG